MAKGVKEMAPLGTVILLIQPPPAAGRMFIPTRVPRIPAVPTGESMLKLDSFLSFLMSTTMSPTLRSMRTSEALGSSLMVLRFVPAGILP